MRQVQIVEEKLCNMPAVQGVETSEVISIGDFDKLQDGIKVAVQKGPGAVSPQGSQ